jgi:hypothetical protein
MLGRTVSDMFLSPFAFDAAKVGFCKLRAQGPYSDKFNITSAHMYECILKQTDYL